NRLAVAGDGLAGVLCASTARQHFARLVVDVGLVDWLSLDPAGHRRARFKGAPGDWEASWCVP
ncbi:MAG: hypothetical protein ACRCUI_07295, partial [Polymorphobacter sp.]